MAKILERTCWAAVLLVAGLVVFAALTDQRASLSMRLEGTGLMALVVVPYVLARAVSELRRI